MNRPERRSVQVRLWFPNARAARPDVERLGLDHGLAVSILRGRVTEAEASFEMKIEGGAEAIDGFIRSSAGWGASVAPRGSG